MTATSLPYKFRANHFLLLFFMVLQCLSYVISDNPVKGVGTSLWGRLTPDCPSERPQTVASSEALSGEHRPVGPIEGVALSIPPENFTFSRCDRHCVTPNTFCYIVFFEPVWTLHYPCPVE
jgi:hypothetical protein